MVDEFDSTDMADEALASVACGDARWHRRRCAGQMQVLPPISAGEWLKKSAWT